MPAQAGYILIDGVQNFVSGLAYANAIALGYFNHQVSETWSLAEAIGSYGCMLALSTRRQSQLHWHYYYYKDIDYRALGPGVWDQGYDIGELVEGQALPVPIHVLCGGIMVTHYFFANRFPGEEYTIDWHYCPNPRTTIVTTAQAAYDRYVGTASINIIFSSVCLSVCMSACLPARGPVRLHG